MEVLQFHVDGERHHNEARAEVDSREYNDEQSGYDLLATSPEHPQNGGITGGAECTQKYQKRADDVARSGRRAIYQVLLQLILKRRLHLQQRKTHTVLTFPATRQLTFTFNNTWPMIFC